MQIIKLFKLYPRNDCKEKGGQLGSVHSDEENSFIKKLLRNQPQRSGYVEQATWLGALLYAQDQYFGRMAPYGITKTGHQVRVAEKT